MTRFVPMVVASCFAASCINYTGLEGDGSDYTKPVAVSAGGATTYTCAAADADDGTSAAAGLGAASLACQYRSSGSTWAMAMGYCAGLGSGWRLPSKGEALKVASSSSVCRMPFSGGWLTWTSSCASAGLAWVVGSSGSTSRGSVDYRDVSRGAFCVR